MAFEAGEFAADASAQMTTVGWHEVRQSPVLDVRPNLLVGIELGRITREPLRPYPRLLRQPDPHRLGPVMRVASIPHDCDGPSDVPRKMPEEFHHVESADVPVIRKEAEIEVALLAPRTFGDGADGRDAVAAVPGREHGCFPARGEGPPPRRHEHEARFVRENDVGAPTPGVFLCEAILHASNARFPPHPAHGRAVQVSGSSSPAAASRPAAHGRHSKLRQNASELAGQSGSRSKGRYASRALSGLAAEASPTPALACRSVREDAPDGVWRKALPVRRGPLSASGRLKPASNPGTWQYPWATRLQRAVAPPAVGGAPVQRHFLLVSCHLYRQT